MGATPWSIVRGAGFLRMDQLKDFCSPKAFPAHRHRTQSAQQPDLQLSLYGECLPSLAPPDRVNALLLEGDLAGYDVGCIGHRMGVPF